MLNTTTDAKRRDGDVVLRRRVRNLLDKKAIKQVLKLLILTLLLVLLAIVSVSDGTLVIPNAELSMPM